MPKGCLCTLAVHNFAKFAHYDILDLARNLRTLSP